MKKELTTKKVQVPFSQLPKNEQRIKIAKDIIAQVKLNKYVAMQGYYVNVDNYSEFDSDSSAQKLLKQKKLDCTVCALGAAFCSLVKFDNKATLEELDNGNFSKGGGFRKRLEKYFEKKQLAMLEAAFERDIIIPFVGTDELKRKVISFRNDMEDSVALIKIFNNVIKNNGDFVV